MYLKTSFFSYYQSICLALLLQSLLILGLACPSPAQHAVGSSAVARAAAKARASALKAAEKRAAALAAWRRRHPIKVVVGKTVNLSSYGGNSTGTQDNSKALAAAIAAAGAHGTVNFGSGRFLCSTMVLANNVSLAGAGPGSTTFIPTRPTNCAIKLTGTASLSGLTISPVQVANGASAQDSAVWVNGASGSITNLNITQASYGGIYLQNAEDFTVSNSTVSNFTTNYGVEIIDCTKVTVDHVTVNTNNFNCGTVNTSANTTGSTGVTISNCVFNGYNPVTNTNLTGTLINCSVINNVFSRTGLNVVTQTSTLTNLLISGNKITDAGESALSIRANPGSNSAKGITISNNSVSLKSFVPFGAGDVNEFETGIEIEGLQNASVSGNSVNGYSTGIGVYGCKNTTISQNSVNTIGGSGLYFSSLGTANANYDCAGYLTISNNTTANCCVVKDQSGGGIIFGTAPWNSPASPLSLSIVNNKDTGPANFAPYYINCLFPGAHASGNKTTTLLPSNIVP